MLKYLIGFFQNLFNRGVSWIALIDCYSRVSHKAKVYSYARIFNSTIDEYSYVGKRTSIICTDVGKFCSIAGGSIIGMGIHTLKNLSTSPIFTEKYNGTGYSWCKSNQTYPYKRVSVGNDVWIGARVMVMGGVTIGDGAVIGAGAIVTNDVPPYAIVGGVPAKIIRFRFPDEVISQLLLIEWWNLPESVLRQNIRYFQTEVVDVEMLKNITRQ